MVSEPPVNEVAVDLEDGGRWTSLQLAGREWLWSGPGLVSGPRTGITSYVDVGGLEECFPTVRGWPDHGGLWNQAWSTLDEDEDWDVAQYEEAVLLRRFTGGDVPDDAEPGTVWADYRLVAPAGYRFIWAAHALLDCAVGATLTAPADTVCRLYPDPAPALIAAWPSGLDTYAADDGSAVGAVLLDCPVVSVRDRGLELSFALSCPGQPVSTAVWRNLGGFPADAPYRSLGVEPMLGRVFELAEAGPGDAAVVPASGELTWRLVITARPAAR
jgi:hypothetical protein